MTIAAADCFVQRRGVWPVFRVDGNENEPCVCGTGPLMQNAVWLIAALAVVAQAFSVGSADRGFAEEQLMAVETEIAKTYYGQIFGRQSDVCY